jgi:hypothetical protein
MKTTKAFQLEVMKEPVRIAFDKKNKKWYPLNGCHSDAENNLFIYGRGHVKIGKWKKETVEALPVLTAEGIKAIYDKYGLNVAMGMVRGWGGYSLFHDNSCGLNYVKYEIANMATFGKEYDIFTDKVQVIGDQFVKELLTNGFTLHGTIEKGSLWYGYKNENDCGNIIGSVGIYEKVWLHPLQYVDHCVGMAIFGCRFPPNFNPISFDDNLLAKLFMYKYYDADMSFKTSDKMLKKIVSVYDRIKHLTSKESADAIKSIFELQKVFFKDIDKAKAA